MENIELQLSEEELATILGGISIEKQVDIRGVPVVMTVASVAGKDDPGNNQGIFGAAPKKKKKQ